MQEETIQQIPADQEFGITEQEEKNYKLQGILARIKYYFQSAEPFIVKMLNSIIYTTIKFLKTVVTMIIRMALGKDV